jgi:hypothetical protein
MYLESAIAEDKNIADKIAEDEKMVESWKKDADRMLVFVGLQTTSHTSAYNLEIVDWYILCCGRGFACGVRPEYSAEPAGHLSLLSRTYLSVFSTEWVPSFYPVELVRPHQAIHSTYVGCLG